MARYAIIFVLGAVLGTLYDWIHVAFGVLTYADPHFAGSSFWVPLEFGLAGVVGAGVVSKLGSRFSLPAVSFKRIVFDGTLLLIAYLLTGVFAGRNELTFAILVPIVFLSIGTRPNKALIVGSLVAGALGPIGETLLSMPQLGFFRYTYAEFIPVWLPLLWMVAAGLFLDLSVICLNANFNRKSMKPVQ